MNVIVFAFLARAGSGKTTAANYLVENYGASKVSFAGPLKELAKQLYGFDDEQVYGKHKETPDPRLSFINRDPLNWRGPGRQTIAGEKVTPRQMLQCLGNQARNTIGPSVWIDAAMNSIANSGADIVVIDDCRYVNEAQAISTLSRGHVIKIVSPDRVSNADPYHPSEAQTDDVPNGFLTATIVNHQHLGLESLHSQIKDVVERII